MTNVKDLRNSQQIVIKEEYNESELQNSIKEIDDVQLMSMSSLNDVNSLRQESV